MAYLKKNNIETIIHYPIPPYRQKCYEDIVLDNQNTLLSSKICKSVLSLPIGPHFNKLEIQYVSKVINKFKI